MREHKEYRVEIKVRNNIFLKKIEECGYTSLGNFCNINNISAGDLGAVVNLKKSPLTKMGQFVVVLKKASEALGCAPQELFSSSQLNMCLSSNKRYVELSEAEVDLALGSIVQDSIENITDSHNMINELKTVLGTLTAREKKVLELRFGLNGGNNHTLEEVGKQFDVTRECIREIEAKALRKLRHPSRADKLCNYLE